MRTKILSGCAVIALMAIGGSHAFAGKRTTTPVFISAATGAGFAYGALGSARNSGDPTQDIGCTTFFSGFNQPTLIGCTATNSAGVYRTCLLPFTSQAVFGIQALSDDTLLYFTWDANGSCTEIRMTDGSEYSPKAL